MSGADVVRSDDERKLRYMERQAVKQRKQSAERSAMLDKCVDAINALGSATVRELCNFMGIVEVTARKYMKSLHESKRIYVFDHVQHGKTFVPLFKVGNLPDAPRELIERPAQPTREETEGEALARIDADKKHAAWAKQWKPHRDPAAAWF